MPSPRQATKATQPLNIVLVGSPRVGKKSLIQLYVDKMVRSPRQYKPTIGADLKTKNVGIDGKRYDLNLWNVSGNGERPKSGDTPLTTIFRIADAVIFVMCDDPTAAQVAKNYYDDHVVPARETMSREIPLIFCVNKWDVAIKKDDSFKREDDAAVRRLFDDSIDDETKIFFCSGWTGVGVVELFQGAWGVNGAVQIASETRDQPRDSYRTIADGLGDGGAGAAAPASARPQRSRRSRAEAGDDRAALLTDAAGDDSDSDSDDSAEFVELEDKSTDASVDYGYAHLITKKPEPEPKTRCCGPGAGCTIV